MSLSRWCLAAALLGAAACTDSPSPAPEQVTSSTAALTGAEAQSIPAVTLNNAIVTQRFQSDLLTPDGRLGLGFLSATEARFRLRALRDPELGVTSGVPRFAVPMQPADDSAPGVYVDVTSPMPAEVPAVPRPHNGTLTLRVWTNSGQGSLTLDPRYAPSGKPFAVDEPGSCAAATPATRDGLVSPGGRYECYRLLHFQPFYVLELYTENNEQKEELRTLAIFQAELVVVVDARRPSTTAPVTGRSQNPRIVQAQYRTGFSVSRGQPGNTLLWALEPSATADGRLLVAQGGFWSFNETPWNPNTWSSQLRFSELYDSVKNKVICRHLNALTGQPDCVADDIISDYEPFARVYPVAAQPLFRADGSRPLPGQQECGYTWITPEGTDVFCRPNTEAEAANETFALGLRQSFESSTGMHFFSFGQHTGWMLRRIDGGINTRRFNPEALYYGGPPPPGANDLVERPFSPLFLNTSTGFWAENRTSSEKSLPVLRRWPLFQFMTKNNALTRPPALSKFQAYGLVPSTVEGDMQYWEASFACGVNPDCLLHLPMNELAYNRAAAPGLGGLPPALPLTHDSSNNTDFFQAGTGTPEILAQLHPYVGTLTGGARFIGDAFGPWDDEGYLSGYRGTAITLGAASSIRILSNEADFPCRRNKGCLAGQDFDTGYTAELAFLLLFDPNGATIPLAEQPGLWSLRLQNGALVATVTYALNGQPQPPLTLSVYAPFPFASQWDYPSAQAPKWRHVALRLSPAEQRVTLFIGGMPVAGTALPREAKLGVAAPSSTGSVELVRVGPAGACTGCPADYALFVDELALHKAALPFEELAASGSAFAGRSDFLTPTEVRTLISSYFRTANPRQLSLHPDGFPRFVRPEDLRVPAVFSPLLAPGREAGFRQLVAVGQELFSSPVLSTDAAGNTQLRQGTQTEMSCATCHEVNRSFTEDRALALGVRPGVLNTPTILNRALGTRQFFARRASDLMDQALQPVMDRDELNGDVDRILVAINTQSRWASLRTGFTNVFGTTPVTREHLAMALTAYQLVQLNVEPLADAVMASGRSFLDGGKLLRPEVLRQGKELFEGKARCTACHVGAQFTDELAHDTGVSATPKAFKTPTLWDIAKTAPYFHDGSRGTLREVLEFYNAGGVTPGRVRDGLRLVDPELRPLALSVTELDALETYLRALQNARPVLKNGTEGLVFSNHGPVPGMSCTQTYESQDPNGWDDNYVCSVTDVGLTWSSAGPMTGMRCTAVNEGAEPQATTWGDNFMCVSANSPLQLSWSQAGPLAGRSCVRFYEPADPNAWSDNYLCYEPPPRLYGILRSNTGSGKIEVHSLDGLGEYQSFWKHTATGLPQVANDHAWEFAFGDYNGDGALDLWAIARVNTASGMTEVNVMSGADDFRTLLTRRVTALGPSGADRSWRFLVADFNADGWLDLYSVNTAVTGSNMTEVHVLNGIDGFSTFLDHIPTALGLTGSGSTAEFALADSNGDGKLDLFAITKVNTASGRTEVDVLDGANRFRSFLRPRRQTVLGSTGSDEAWKFGVVDYNRDGEMDLFGISRTNTGTGTTEIHVLNGADGFSTFLQQRGTGLHLTGTDASWTFELK